MNKKVKRMKPEEITIEKLTKVWKNIWNDRVQSLVESLDKEAILNINKKINKLQNLDYYKAEINKYKELAQRFEEERNFYIQEWKAEQEKNKRMLDALMETSKNE